MPVRFYGGPLNALSEGFAAGAQGFAQNTLALRDRKRQAERDAENDRRYEEEKARAIEATAYGRQRDTQLDARFDRQQNRLEAKDALDLSQDTQRQEASSQLAQFAVTGNRMGPPDPEEQFAMSVAEKMRDPQMSARFIDEYERQARQKMILGQREKHLSAWQDLMRSPALGELPGRQEEIAARAKEATDLLQNVEDPEQLAEILKTSAKGLNDTRVSMAKDLDKAATYKRTVEYYGPQLAEMQAATKGLPPDMAEEMQRRISTLSTALGGVQAGILDPSQMQRLWYATMNQRPQGAGASKQPTEAQIGPLLIQKWKAMHPDKKNPITGHVVEQGAPLDHEWYLRELGIATGQRERDPYKNMGDDEDTIRAEMRNAPKPTEQPQPQASGPKGVVKFTEAPPETQRSVEEALRAAVAYKRRGDIRRIFAESNIDPDSITPEAFNRILGATPGRLESVKVRSYSLGGK